MNETFTKADFLYGPNKAKPGPGTLGTWTFPFVSGQPIGADNTYMMFIDLNVGNNSNLALIDGGSAKVVFTVDGLYNTMFAFNAYAYAADFNITPDVGAINWTNNLSTNSSAPGQSGYSITATGPASVPARSSAQAFPVSFSTFGGFAAWWRRRRCALPRQREA